MGICLFEKRNTEVDTGSWSLEGNILALTSNTGKVYGVKKE